MDTDRLNKVINDIRNFYLHRDPEGPEKIKNIITEIKNVYSSGWEKDRLPFIREFCSKASQGIPVAALSVCGKDTQGIKYNKYLAYFLDPSSQHGLGDKLLKAFMNLTGEDTDGLDLSHCIVETEKWMVGYSCDISITGQEYCILIEQKLLSPESIGKDTEVYRLRRYNEAISNNEELKNMKIIKIYLTSAVRVPESLENWHVITQKSITEWGIKLFEDNTLSSTARSNLVRFLLDLSPGPYYEIEEDVKNMLDTGNYMIDNGFNFSKAVQLNRLFKEHKLLVRLLMEG